MSEPRPCDRRLRAQINVSPEVMEILSDSWRLQEFERRMSELFWRGVAQRLDEEIIGRSPSD